MGSHKFDLSDCKLVNLYVDSLINPCLLNVGGFGVGFLLILISIFTVRRKAVQCFKSSTDYLTYFFYVANMCICILIWILCTDVDDHDDELNNLEKYGLVIQMATFALMFVLHYFLQSSYFQHYSYQMMLTWILYTAVYFCLARNEVKRKDSSEMKENLYYIQFGVNCALAFVGICFGRLEGQPEIEALGFNYFRLQGENAYDSLRVPKLGIEDRAGFLSKRTFWWMNDLFVTGYKRQLDFEDITPYFSPKYDCNVKYKQFQEQWDRQPEGEKSVWKSCLFGFGWSYLCNGLLKITYDCTQLINPILLKLMLEFIGDKDAPDSDGIKYCLILLGAGILGTLVLQTYWHIGFGFGMDVRSALSCAIYAKVLKLTPSARREHSAGQMMNLVTTDLKKIRMLFPYLWLIVSAPFQVIIIMFLLYNEIGYSIFVGCGFSFVLMMPLNWWFAKVMKVFQKERLKVKDKRLSIMNEIFGAIKVLKLYAWEEIFSGQIKQIREDEVHWLKQIIVYGSFSSFIWTTIPIYLIVLSLVTYVCVAGGTLTASRAFTTILLCNMLRFPLAVLPRMISWFAECAASVERVRKFLDAEEVVPDEDIERVDKDSRLVYSVGSYEQPGVFYWDNQLTSVALQGLNFEVLRGDLIMVVGKIGTGKSAFLKALIGELTRDNGPMAMSASSSVAFTDQVSWIQNLTVRKNITFGKKYDKEWYKQVIHACAMIPDLNQLTDADRTEIGEKGINLSGGQKQRVALARAVYQNSDVYLLDDPLSAVDVHVASHVMEHCILGLLRATGKTTVLCTNALKFLVHADKILVLEQGGEQVAFGTYDELQEQGIDFEKFVTSQEELMEREKAEILASEPELSPQQLEKRMSAASSQLSGGTLGPGTVLVEPEPVDIEITDESVWQPHEDEEEERRRTQSIILLKNADQSYEFTRFKTEVDNRGQLIKEEFRKKGSAGKKTYCIYKDRLGGWPILAPYLAGLLLVYGCQIGADRWMAHWAEESGKDSGHPETYYLAIYCAIACSPIPLYIFTLVFKCTAMLNGARSMHHNMLEAIMKAPMKFFDTTPRGRITNRFSSDQSSVDETLPGSFDSFLRTGISNILTFGMIIAVIPLFAAILVPLIFVYWWTCLYYLATNRELKRWQQVLNSPIFSLFSETIDGVTSIRAFNQMHNFQELNNNRLNRDHVAYFGGICANRWLAVRLEFIGAGIVFGAALFATLSRHTISAGLAGLAISYSMTITQALNWTVRQTSEVETNIVSVERIEEYTQVSPEPPRRIPATAPPESWPQNGRVEFRGVQMRYREGLDTVLNGVNFTIEAGEKVGIVGRTGSGKSSLFVVLMRLVDACGGGVFIDGVDISKLGVHDLREKIAIIPQDPVMFQGTIASNIDPIRILDKKLSRYSDEQIEEALENSRLMESLDPYVQQKITLDQIVQPAGATRFTTDQDIEFTDINGNIIQALVVNPEVETDEKQDTKKLMVKGLPGIERVVSENGDNFSVGQRQLMCLARALLRNSKILLLDEATSAVDQETDAVIQETLRDSFPGTTTLTIAHRINTILDYDKILVMEKGQVLEFGTPAELLDQMGTFWELVQEEKKEQNVM